MLTSETSISPLISFGNKVSRIEANLIFSKALAAILCIRGDTIFVNFLTVSGNGINIGNPSNSL